MWRHSQGQKVKRPASNSVRGMDTAKVSIEQNLERNQDRILRNCPSYKAKPNHHFGHEHMKLSSSGEVHEVYSYRQERGCPSLMIKLHS